ncbi:hypothetical protein AMTRI_Chr07g81550 [Amborella trichopoda]
MTSDLELPPGFRFHPTDEELVMHYLCRKCASQPIAVPIIAEIDLYKYDPWQLPGVAVYGEKEWYFFSPRDRKYPNGSRPNRAAGSGYWKATGADKPIGLGPSKSNNKKAVGIKKALVFYSGKPPKGQKTNWIMHEYRLADVDRAPRKNNNLRLDDWVLCRIYNKKGSLEKASREAKWGQPPLESTVDRKPLVGPMPAPIAQPQLDVMQMEGSDSAPRLYTDSSCSEHAPELACEREVQSEAKWREWDWNGLGLLDELLLNTSNSNPNTLPPLDQLKDPFYQDFLFYTQKPF